MSADPIADLQQALARMTDVATQAVKKYTDLVGQLKATDVVVHDAYVPVANAAYVLTENAQRLQAVIDNPSLASDLHLLSPTDGPPQ